MAWPTLPTPADAQNCMLYGFIRDAAGTPIVACPVLLGPPGARPEHRRVTVLGAGAGEGQVEDWVEVLTDSTGYWQAEVRRGIVVRVVIARLRFDVEGLVPEQDNQDFCYWAYQPQLLDSRQFCADPVNAPAVVDTTLVLKLDSGYAALVLDLYDQIQIYESSTRNGVYLEKSTPATRIELIDGQAFYNFTMSGVAPGKWYRARYYNSVNLVQGPLGPPMKASAQAYANVITVEELKEIYLFGVNLTDDTGKPYSRDLFERYIKSALTETQRELDVSFAPTAQVESQDFVAADFVEWEFVLLDHIPVIAVDKVEHMLGQQVLFSLPTNWYNLDTRSGQLRIIPQQGTLAAVMLGALGNYIGPAIGATRDWPGYIRVTYRHGFQLGQIPDDIKDMVGMKAALGPLNIAGDLIAGAGVASWSASMDGLSQSVSTTSSATNAGYGARIIQYQKQIDAMMKALKRYWQGVRMQVA